MGIRCYLDDVRDMPDLFDVLWRSTQEGKDWIQKHGCPDFISFDFDLGGNDRAIDLVKWLIEQDIEHNIIPKGFGFSVHSANPVGGKQIREMLNNYLEFKKEEATNEPGYP